MTGDQPQPTVFEQGSKVHEYWLAHAEGFHVVSGRRPRDRVHHVVVDRERGSATALVVRRKPGRRPRRIPVRSVSAVDPFERVLYLAPPQPVRSAAKRARPRVTRAAAAAGEAQRAGVAWLRPRALVAVAAARRALVHAALWLRPRLVEVGRRATHAYTRGYHAVRAYSQSAYSRIQPRLVALARDTAGAVRKSRV